MIRRLHYKSWTVRQRRWAAGLAAAFAAWSLIGFLVLPPVIRSQLLGRLPALTQRETSVRQVRVNPWTLSLTIRGLELKEPGGQMFASWEEFYINFQLSSLLRWAWTFKEISLVEPRGAVIVLPDGQLNFANMFGPAGRADPPPQKSGIPRVRVSLLNITNGVVRFEDRKLQTPFQAEYRPINLRLVNLTTRPGREIPYSFRAESAGKTLDWAGDIMVQPFSSHGIIAIENAELQRYQPYLERYTTAKIAGGRLNLRSDYSVSAGPGGVDLVVTNASGDLAGLKLLDPRGGESVLSVPAILARGARLDLRRRQGLVQELRIDGLDLLARVNEDKSLNLLRLLLPSPAGEAAATNASAPWDFTIAGFALTHAALRFEDRARTALFQTRLQPVELAVSNLTTRPAVPADFRFSITTEASEQLGGRGTLQTGPARSAGEISLAGLQLQKYVPYLEPFLPGQTASGKFYLSANYQTGLDGGALAAAASNVVLRFADFQLVSRETGETAAVVPELAVEGVAASLQERSVRAARLKTTGGAIRVRRETNGVIQLSGFAPPTPAPAREPGSSKPEAPWTAVLDELAVEDYAVDFEDRLPSKPAVTKLDRVTVTLQGVSSAPAAPISAALALRINDTGALTTRGTAALSPVAADLEISLTNVVLRPFQSYLEPHARLDFLSGAASMGGHARWASQTNGGQFQFTGSLAIRDLAAADQTASNEFVRWKALTFEGIDLKFPGHLRIDAIQAAEVGAHLSIDTNQQMNLAAIFPPSAPPAGPAAPPSPPTTASPAPAFPIAIDSIALADSVVRFSDASVQPAARIEAAGIGGTVKGLSSDPGSAAEVSLAGLIDQSPFSISGKLNPLASGPHFDLVFSNRNLQLTPFSPYMEKFTGYPLNRGRLSLNLDYQVRDKELKAQNRVQVDQLTLGARVPNTNATALPVKLAVALLKDSNGQILLDLPLSGRLDDPAFRVGPVILKVIVNLITKTAASPFKLLGAAFGGGEELSFLEFVPGTAKLADHEAAKIPKLIQALAARPGLSLELEGSVDPRRDREALALQAVRNDIKKRRLEELAAAGEAPEDFEVEPGEARRLLRAAVSVQFGADLDSAVEALMSETNAVVAAGLDHAPQGKWFQRLTGPFHRKGSPEALARRRAKEDAELVRQNPQLGTLSVAIMERLLASKIEVSPDDFARLRKERVEAARAALLEAGGLTEDQIFMQTAKPGGEGPQGEARVLLSLN